MTRPDQPVLALVDGIPDHLQTMEAEQCRSDELIAHLQDRIVTIELAYTHLEGAITSSRRIGAAIGIVMSTMKITEDEAFGILTKISQRQNRKLRLVADDIVLTGSF